MMSARNQSAQEMAGTTMEGAAIPNPKEKPEWPVTERVKWLQTAANIFDLLYTGEGGIKIELAIAPRSPRPGE